MINHIAFIMDGNRRWAKNSGLLQLYGHKEGVNTVKRVASFCLEKKIKHLSLYTFSIENFKRSEREKAYLFNMIVKEARKSLQEFKKRGIRVAFVGDRSLFPDIVLPVCEELELETALCDNLHIQFLFCYGARQEIVSGVKKIVQKVKKGELCEHDINETILQDHLWSSDFPEPDLIVRTGGQVRLSNFLLYQAAYSEFCFLDCMWPELSESHLNSIVAGYLERQRNFGV